jgi:hypothetical protein
MTTQHFPKKLAKVVRLHRAPVLLDMFAQNLQGNAFNLPGQQQSVE